MKVQFCSDLHLGHDLASDLRGFDTVAEHDDSIFASLEASCTKRTHTYFLGDIAFTRPNLERLADIKGRKVIILGNHDNFKAVDYLKSFDDIYGFVKYKNMWLSHAPIHPQELWRCDANIHGHIHDNAATACIGFPYINMNWDFRRSCVTLDEVKEFIRLKTDGIPSKN